MIYSSFLVGRIPRPSGSGKLVRKRATAAATATAASADAAAYRWDIEFTGTNVCFDFHDIFLPSLNINTHLVELDLGLEFHHHLRQRNGSLVEDKQYLHEYLF